MASPLRTSFTRRVARPLAAFPALVLALACEGGDSLLGPGAARPGTSPSTSTTATSDPGRGHFFFLPPMAGGATYSGTFDAGRSPTVTVCQVGTGGACGAPLATFTRTTGPGAETVRIDVPNQLYVANWKLDATKFPVGRYRVAVADGALPLGSVEVAVVAAQKSVKPGYSPLTVVVGSTLAVKFRLEVGVPFAVSPTATTPQTIATPVTAEGTTAALVLPANSGSSSPTITVDPVPTGSTRLASSSVLVPGTVFDFGPNGTTFAKPATLTISYDPAKLPAGIPAAALGMYWLDGARWRRLDGSRVDAARNTVSGETPHFTEFGILSGVASVQIGTLAGDGATVVRPDTLIDVGQTRQLSAVLRDTAGTVLTDRVVTWSARDSLTSVDPATGAATARYPGVSTITATSEGRTDTFRLRVRGTVTAEPVRLHAVNSNYVAPGQIVFARVSLPSVPPAPVAVTLTASDPRVVTMPTTVTLPAGSYSAWVNIVGAAAGSTTVTASAGNYSAGSVEITVGPGKLGISSGVGTGGVQEVGARDQVSIILPDGPMAQTTTFALATSDNLRVVDGAGNRVTSIDVAASTNPATAHAPGRSAPYYVEALAPGPARVTISHPAFVPVTHSFEATAARLDLFHADMGPVAVGQVAYYSVVLGAAAATPVTVTLTPSASTVTAPATVSVPAGARVATFGAWSSSAGTFAITASAPGGYNSPTLQQSVVAPGEALLMAPTPNQVGQRVPAQIVLPRGPMGVATTFALASSGNVRFLDGAGNAITSITVPATSLSAPPPEESRGVSSPQFYVEALAAGPASVTVSHAGFTTMTQSFTIELARITAFTRGYAVGPNQITHLIVDLNRQNTAPVTVTLTPSAPAVSVPASVVVPAGQGYVQVPVYASTTGSFSITAAAPGFESGSAGFGVGLGTVGYGMMSQPQVGQRTRVSLSLSEGPMAVATTFALTASANVRLTDANGNTVTGATVPAGGYGASFYVEGLSAGAGWFTISHPDFDRREASFTVQP